jgi:hypothetical protein
MAGYRAESMISPAPALDHAHDPLGRGGSKKKIMIMSTIMSMSRKAHLSPSPVG